MSEARGGPKKEASHESLHAEKPFRFRIWILKQDGRDYYFLAFIEEDGDDNKFPVYDSTGD